MDPCHIEMMKTRAAAQPDAEFLDLGLGLLSALAPTHEAPRAPHNVWEDAADRNEAQHKPFHGWEPGFQQLSALLSGASQPQLNKEEMRKFI